MEIYGILKDGTKQKMKVKHIMADGSVRDSVKGYEVPYNDITKPFYHILAQAEIRRQEKIKAHESE